MPNSAQSFVSSSISTSSYAHADWKIWFYLVAQLVGGVGLTLLLATMLWPTTKRKPRNPLLISMCFSWWISSFPSVLLLYYVGQVTGPPPRRQVCLASAVLTTSQRALVALTAPALIFHIWLVVQTAVGSRFTDDRMLHASTIICLVSPWIVYGSVALVTLVIGLRDPQLVRRATYYCVINDAHLTETVGTVGSVATLAAIVLEVWIVALLYRNRSSIKQLSRNGRGLDFSLVFRVCVFGVYVFIGLCLNIMLAINLTSPIPDLICSTFPIAIFVVFGTQPDIWRIWRDASRQVTSRHSAAGLNSQSSRSNAFSSTTFSLSFLRPSSRSSPCQRSHPLAPSHPWLPASTHAPPYPYTHYHTRSLPLPPLPAALQPPALRGRGAAHAHARPGFVRIQSTPDLVLQRGSGSSAPSSPTSPISPTSFGSSDSQPWPSWQGGRDVHYPPRRPFSPSAVHGWASPPPTPSVIDLRAASPVDDGKGAAGTAGFGGSCDELLGVPAAAVVRRSAGADDYTPVWDIFAAAAAADGEGAEYDEEGVRVWRAL
ncbi:uncharacterized protein PHACADRAFT_208365 [Phanerochaete carnosa HHB-10118-sp]|uniref:Uncharacterized protein n=1 Tax=Phanerochaete carnosa (strain HHB-10118-sp) TaxID=650164 RepID=K5WDY4_PHACS|nr:uncharacterized protein PHACADRAFT_208365 [Phanerochaete carnosa HHB-10118-sp]EKM57259.1 hypothetical protein PHACADRAFT_208365 [Phanerochaete carnosa HHB-10118-sp]